MNIGRYKTNSFCDQLSNLDFISDSHDSFSWNTDMLT